jgi:acyl dehydratase
MAFQLNRPIPFRRTFSQADFDRFAALSGDDNPIHVDAAYAAHTRFGRTIAHGMLLYSTICAALGRSLPGAVQLEQSLMFPDATYTGEEMVAQLALVEQPDDDTAVLSTRMSRPDGVITCQGPAHICLPGRVAPLPARSWSQVEARPGPEWPLGRLTLGQKATTVRVFTAADVVEYADLTGDSNPIFFDAAVARQAGFNAPIIPGGLLGGLFSFLLGTQLPGPGTNWLKQSLRFPGSAYTGQAITAEVEIVRLRPGKKLVNLRTTARDQAGATVCSGEALVLFKETPAE